MTEEGYFEKGTNNSTQYSSTAYSVPNTILSLLLTFHNNTIGFCILLIHFIDKSEARKEADFHFN